MTKTYPAMRSLMSGSVFALGLTASCATVPDRPSAPDRHVSPTDDVSSDGAATAQESREAPTSETDTPTTNNAETDVVVVELEQSEFAGDRRTATATAELESTYGNVKVGTLHFKADGNRVTMAGEFENLKPGMRGIQIHENGSCDGKGAKASGGDFNPTDAKHGPPDSPNRHVGDLGNIEVDKSGKAEFHMTTDSITLVEDGPSSVIGRSIVITRRRDNGKSQPNGNAGPAMACGVIRAN